MDNKNNYNDNYVIDVGTSVNVSDAHKKNVFLLTYDEYKNYIRLTSVALIIVSLFLAAILYEKSVADNYKYSLENSYNKSFNEITEALDVIEGSLEKSELYTQTEDLVPVFSVVYKETGNMESSLEDLPYNESITLNISKFLNQISDFSSVFPVLISGVVAVMYLPVRVLNKTRHLKSPHYS